MKSKRDKAVQVCKDQAEPSDTDDQGKKTSSS